MVYGYARVSSTGQGLYGGSLSDQEEILRRNGCEEIYRETYTGTRMDRPVFGELLGKLKKGDRLVVTKLDRFARTTSGGIDTIRSLLDKGVSVHILNMGLIDNTSTGRLMVTMLLAFAEFERDMIVERTSAGKRVRKAENPDWREGRKRITLDDSVLSDMIGRVRSGSETIRECCAELGISDTTWYKLVKEYGQRTGETVLVGKGNRDPKGSREKASIRGRAG